MFFHRFLSAIVAGVVVCCVVGSAAAAKPRVMSLNLCTDQLVLALADPEQIISVSRAAFNPLISFHAARAQYLKPLINRRSAEEAVQLRPDVVWVGAWDVGVTRQLRSLGIRVESFMAPTSLDAVEAEIIRAGAILEQPERAAAQVAALQQIRGQTQTMGDGRLAAFYFADGYTYGDKTLLHDLFRAVGLKNLAAENQISGIGRLDLEHLIMARPDILFSDMDIAQVAPRIATDVMTHPALRRAVSDARRLALPLRFWTCSGDSSGQALLVLSDSLRRISDKQP